LATYSKADRGWSHAEGAASAIANKGGVAGAWLADLLLFLFGVSAGWWVVAGAVLVTAGYRRIKQPEEASEHPLPLRIGGFVLVLFASAAIESLRFDRLPATLPQRPGGAFGEIL